MLSLIEVNRESLPESLALVLKHEYGCHRRNMKQTELCLSRQLESSDSAYQILEALHDMEPKTGCQLFWIWVSLFLTSLAPNLTLGTMDISADAILSQQYYNEWMNGTFVTNQNQTCYDLTHNSSNRKHPLEAFEVCLNSESKFKYTIAFLLLSVVFYLIEFLVLDSKYEPTGLRKKISVSNTNPICFCVQTSIMVLFLLRLILLAYSRPIQEPTDAWRYSAA